MRVIFLLLLLPTFLCAQDSLSLDQAISLALERNYDIRLSSNEAEIARLNNTRANAGLLPLVTLNASDNLSAVNFQQRLSNGTEITRPLGINNAFNANLAASYTLYNGGRLYLEKGRLEALDALGKKQLNAQIKQTTLEVSLAWFQVATLSATVKNLKEVLAVVTERYQLASNRLEFGFGNQADVLQAQIDLNQRNQALILTQNSLNAAKFALNTLLGRDPGISFEATSTTIAPAFPALDKLVSELLTSNDNLEVLRQTVRISELVEQQAYTLQKPTLSVNGAYNFTRSDNNAGFFLFNQQHGPVVGINFSMPIYTGGNIQRQQEVAKLGKVAASLRFEQLQANLLQQLYNLYHQYQAFEQTNQLVMSNLEFARQQQVIALERFRQGQSTALDIREAQLTLENALLAVTQNRFDILVTAARLNALL
jgi:outer membrane protein TolC